MIAFGSSISGAEAYRRYAEPGIRLVAEPETEILAYARIEPVARTYNLMLDAMSGREDLEALVLVHPHTEIADRRFCTKVREALSDPEVALVGCAGARGVGSIAWWEGEVVCGPVRQRYEDHGGGELDIAEWWPTRPERRGRPPAEVDAVDGQLLVLSPWAVRHLRFDERLLLGHGFDLDVSLQARQAGRKLLVADLTVVHHRSIELVSDLAIWVEAHIAVAEKWDAALRGETSGEEAWKTRARRAEARREAARAIAISESLKLDARVLELECQLEAMTSTVAWRGTAPLRAVNHKRREARARRRERSGSQMPKPWD